ncbi:hypothetical protein ACFL1X_10960 [Candidatus Hydrogenedentota bacterium]
MLTQTPLAHLREYPQLVWISALRNRSVCQLVNSGSLQMSLFDERNLAEITSREFPGERLAVCLNPMLADERRRKREKLLAATEKELAKIARAVDRRTRTPMSEMEIALRVGEMVNRFKMAKSWMKPA